MSALFLQLAIPLLFFGSCGQDSKEAKELIDEVAAEMKDLPAAAFETEMTTRVQKLTLSTQKASAILMRPNRVRLELQGAGQDALIVLDGSTLWHYLKARNIFLQSRQLGVVKIEQYGVGPLATLFFEKGAGTLLPYLSDAKLGRDRLDGKDCRVISWTVGTEETRLWIEGGRLRQFRTTRSVSDQAFELTIRYGDLRRPSALEPDAFLFSPPKGARLVSSTGEEALLPVGAAAPDVAAARPDGTPVKLSDFKGRPLLVTFWFYG